MSESELETTPKIPLTHFRFTTREIKERLKVCSALSAYIEDVADVESNMSKSLAKIGGHANSSRGDWLANLTSMIENIHRTTTLSKSKQHLSLSTTILQSISKNFPDYIRQTGKKVNAIYTKVQTFSEEFKKEKQMYQKNLERYSRAVIDAESSIRSRDATIEQIDDPNGKFMNRSMAKMKTLAKMSPGDNQRRLNDRCKELVQTVDTLEAQLSIDHQRLLKNQSTLKLSAAKCINEVAEVEEGRAAFLREALSRWCLAEELMAERVTELISALCSQFEGFDTEKEISTLLWAVDQASEQADDEALTDPTSSSDLFPRVDKLLESLDYLRGLLHRLVQTLLEVSETEKLYSRSIMRMLERHGFGKGATSTTSVRSLAGVKEVLCAEVLTVLESPLTRGSWEASTKALAAISDLHLRSAERIVEQMCPPIEATIATLQKNRRELMEKKLTHMQMIQGAQANVEKATLKLTKVQSTLKERRQAVRIAKDGGVDVADIGAEELDASDHSGGAVTGSAAKPVESESSMMARRGSILMKQGLEKMRAVKLSVVVGLETQADRILRIEKQITVLEEEENDFNAAVSAAVTYNGSTHDSARKEILNALNTTKECMCDVIINTKKVTLQSVLDWMATALDAHRTAIAHMRATSTAVDLVRDVKSFCVFAANGSEPPASDVNLLIGENVFCLPDVLTPLDPFEVIRNDTVEEERKFQRLPVDASGELSPTDAAGMETEDHESVPGPTVAEKSRFFSDEDTIAQKSVPGSPPGRVLEDARARALPPGPVIATPVSPGKSVMATAVSPVQPAAPVGALVGFVEGAKSPVPQQNHVSMREIKEETELTKFGLTANDKVLDSFACALYSKSRLGLSHGRVYVTQHFLAFQGWPDTRVLLPLGRLSSIEKATTMLYIPNAILIKDEGLEYFFGSFIDRDPCFALLKSMSDVAKHLIEINGRNICLDSRTLILGMQKDAISDMLSGYSTSSEAQAAAAAAAAVMAEADIVTEAFPEAIYASAALSPPSSSSATVQGVVASPRPVSIAATASPAMTPAPVTSPVLPSSPASALAPAVLSSPSPQTLSSAAATPSTSAPVVTAMPDEPDDKVDLSSLFAKSGIVPLIAQESMQFPALDIFRSCWLEGCGFGDFLEAEGDLEIKYAEWQPFQGTVPEDVSKVKFNFSRAVSYAHPRTTMLMFGPKNAPAKQTHFLYMYGHGSGNVPPTSSNSGDSDCVEMLRGTQPRRGMVLTMTQFDGIPMADCFKVLMYWCFEEDKSAPSGRAIVRLGLHVHFIKSTMLRSQVASGVKDELLVLARKWVGFCKEHTKLYHDEELLHQQQILTTLSANAVASIAELASPSPGEDSTAGLASLAGVGLATDGLASMSVAASVARRGSRVRRGSSSKSLQSLNGFPSNESLASLAGTLDPSELRQGTSASLSNSVAPLQKEEASSQQGLLGKHLNAIVIVLLVLLLLAQWTTSSSLRSQLQDLNRKLDILSTAIEKHISVSASIATRPLSTNQCTPLESLQWQ